VVEGGAAGYRQATDCLSGRGWLEKVDRERAAFQELQEINTELASDW
jgi:hypothetical protein